MSVSDSTGILFCKEVSHRTDNDAEMDGERPLLVKSIPHRQQQPGAYLLGSGHNHNVVCLPFLGLKVNQTQTPQSHSEITRDDSFNAQ